MRLRHKLLAIAVAWALVFGAHAAFVSGHSEAVQADDYSFAALLEKMVDLEWLAETPAPGERGAQFSSYDRASRLFGSSKIDWFANADAGNFLEIRTIDGRKEAVLAELEGPGAIVRIWSANPEGTLRIYLDGEKEPAVQVPFAAAMRGDGDFPFAEPFAGLRARGGNIYFPFTFQKHALVTVQNPGNLYYHVNYVQFPQGTQAETYSQELVEAHRGLIERVAERLADPYGAFEPEGVPLPVDGRLGPGDRRLIIVEDQGPFAVTSISLKVDAEDLDRALRQTLLVVHWDDNARPSIWAPLGDFFGGVPGLRPYESLPLGVLPDGTMYSRWFMPFARRARIEIANEGDQVVHLEGSLTLRPIEWTDRMAYFNAKWRQESRLGNHRDWLILDADGPGRYVGLNLWVMNPVRQWWGEGDEKVYVDGEAFPSTFGTGTEDYFGYAWSSNEVFSHAYHNQPWADGPDNFGHIINSRFHLLDNIPFQESIRFDLELWHWVGDARPTYGAVAYWYSQSNTDAFAEIPVEQRGIDQPPLWRIYEVEGAIEGESLRVLRVTLGIADPQDMGSFTRPGRQWSGDRQLWWRGGNVGDKLYLAVPVPSQGRYRIIGAFTKARDYGIARIAVGDTVLGELDFYDPEVVPTGEMELGEVELNAGTAILWVEITGANPRSVGHMFGLDYLKLIPVEAQE